MLNGLSQLMKRLMGMERVHPWVKLARGPFDYGDPGNVVFFCQWLDRCFEEWMTRVQKKEIEIDTPVVLTDMKGYIQTTLPAQWLTMYVVQIHNLIKPEQRTESEGIGQVYHRTCEKFKECMTLIAKAGQQNMMSPSRKETRVGNVRQRSTHHAQRSALHHAIGYDYRGSLSIELIEHLLACGCCPNQPDAFGVVPLMLLASSNQETWAFRQRCAQLLIDAGADVHQRCTVKINVMGGQYSMMAQSLPNNGGEAECTAADFLAVNDPVLLESIQALLAKKELDEVVDQKAKKMGRTMHL